MNESIKKFLTTNAVALTIAGVSAVVYLSGIILSLRSDLSATQFQVQALQQSTTTVQALIPEVAAIKQASIDTNQKVNILYSRLIPK